VRKVETVNQPTSPSESSSPAMTFLCTIEWDNGVRALHSIGHQGGDYRLSVVTSEQEGSSKAGPSKPSGKETVVGMDLTPAVGMRVVLRRSAVEDMPVIPEPQKSRFRRKSESKEELRGSKRSRWMTVA
jgi:hypothetical protein